MPSQDVLKDLVERIQNGTLKFLEENSEFVVGCDQCGQCCRDRDDILLSPHDVFHMVKATGMKVVDMLKKYTEVYLGPNSNMPIVRIVYRSDSNNDEKYLNQLPNAITTAIRTHPNFYPRQSTVCPFLGRKDSKYYCRIHDNKPYVCRSYPLGRMTSYMAEGTTAISDVKPRYFEQPMYGIPCSGMSRAIKNNTKHTVCEWVGGKEKKDAADRYWVLFDTFTKKMSNIINLEEVYKLQNEDLKQACFNMMMNLLYIEYDFEADDEAFLAQYEKNTNKILEYLEILAMHPNGKLRPKKNKNKKDQPA